VTPLPEPEPEPVEIVEPAVAPEPEPATPAPKVARPDKKKKHEPRVEARKDPEPSPAVDAGAVQAKFKAVTREYRAFKQAYGSRLDGEWTDLASLAQYASKSPEKLQQLDRKIDRFRSLMKAQK
jgi:hypothetical protein